LIKKIKNKYLFFSVFLIAFLFLGANFVFALETSGTGLNDQSSLGDLVLYLYKWGIGIAVLLATISFAIGGVSFIISGDNPTLQGNAKDRMKGAILGLVLMTCSWLILDTINPNLTNLALTPLTPTVVPPPVEQPGVYFYENSDCSGEVSGPFTSSQEDIQLIGTSGIKIVNNPKAEIYYGVILKDKGMGGRCLDPILIDGCSSVLAAFPSAVIFQMNLDNPKSSGNGITFYSKPFGWDSGAESGFFDQQLPKDQGVSVIASNKMCFNYKGIDVLDSYKFKCTNSQCGGRDFKCQSDKGCTEKIEFCDAQVKCWGNQKTVCKTDLDCPGSDQTCDTRLSTCVGDVCNINDPKCPRADDNCMPKGVCEGINGKKLCSNNACETFQDCAGSIKIKGDYLLVLASKDPLNPFDKISYCQIFTKDVPNLKVYPISAIGNKDINVITIYATK
jgi:hypothetical protein